MKNLLPLFALLTFGLAGAKAQFGSFGDVPVDITSENTVFSAGVATADQNVIIRYSDVTIYCDNATYNSETRDVLLSGNVRLYRAGQLFTGDRAVYNLETKVFNAADFRGDFTPFEFAGNSLSTFGSNAYLVKDGLFTTSDSSKPDWHLRARTVRIYPNDRITFSNVRLFVGRTPVFWFPYLYQSLRADQGFTLTPGYSGVWGAYLLSHFTFPISENTIGGFRIDLLSERGIGLGFDSQWSTDKDRKAAGAVQQLGASDDDDDKRRRNLKEGRGWGRFRSYYIDDLSPGINRTANNREPIDAQRYRISLQDRTYFTEDIYSSIDINKLSDRRFLQDYAEGEFRQNPNPDNMIALTKWDENYAITLVGRQQLNTGQDGTERLPEGALEFKRQPIFGQSGIYYESETSAGFLRRNFANNSPFPDYETFRADTFHQFTFPTELGGWLSFVPRFGFRGTYYSASGFTDTVTTTTDRQITETDPVTGITTTRTLRSSQTNQRLRPGGSLFRPVLNAGFETSFKISRAYEQVQSHAWGLDGLRHVVQPYANLSLAWAGDDPSRVLQFDTLRRSTQLPPIDFPQFNTIDSIDNWAILRLGVRNRFQTRRDNQTFNWLEVDTFFDTNFERPDFGLSVNPDDGTFSNLVNRLRWYPVPWANLQLQSQLPVFDRGFTEVNTSVNFVPNASMQFNVGHRYISGNKLFFDSNLLDFGAYFRINDNWAVSFRESYEFQDSTLENQIYEVHRDLSSWVASLGVQIRDNKGTQKSQTDVGVVLTFTLKDIPDVRIPVSLLPSSSGSGSGKNR